MGVDIFRFDGIATDRAVNHPGFTFAVEFVVLAVQYLCLGSRRAGVGDAGRVAAASPKLLHSVVTPESYGRRNISRRGMSSRRVHFP